MVKFSFALLLVQGALADSADDASFDDQSTFEGVLAAIPADLDAVSLDGAGNFSFQKESNFSGGDLSLGSCDPVSEEMITSVGMGGRMQGFCEQALGCGDYREWSIQGHSDWHDKPNPNPHWPCLRQGMMHWFDHYPEDADEVGDSHTCDNSQGTTDLECSPSLSRKFVDSVGVTITKGVHAGISVQVEANVIFAKVTAESHLDVDFSKSSTETHSKENDITANPTVTMKPGQVTCLSMWVNTRKESAKFWTVMQLEGDILCRFNSGRRRDRGCKGHYLWYSAVDSTFPTCPGCVSKCNGDPACMVHYVDGVANNLYHSHSGVRQTPGRCPDSLEDPTFRQAVPLVEEVPRADVPLEVVV